MGLYLVKNENDKRENKVKKVFNYTEKDKELLLDHLEDLSYSILSDSIKGGFNELGYTCYDRAEMKLLIMEHHDLFMESGRNNKTSK